MDYEYFLNSPNQVYYLNYYHNSHKFYVNQNIYLHNKINHDENAANNQPDILYMFPLQ